MPHHSVAALRVFVLFYHILFCLSNRVCSADVTESGGTRIHDGTIWARLQRCVTAYQRTDETDLGTDTAHNGHPVLRWMMDNIFIRRDPAGNIKPDKEKSTEKIDGAVAMIMALDRAIRCGCVFDESVYDTRWIRDERKKDEPDIRKQHLQRTGTDGDNRRSSTGNCLPGIRDAQPI